MNSSRLIRVHAEQVAMAFAMQMYQRYRYDDLSDWMADEYTLYGGLLSLGALAHTPAASPIRDAYVDLEKESVEGFMGPEEAPDNIQGTEHDGTEHDALEDYHQAQAAELETALNNLDGTGGWV